MSSSAKNPSSQSAKDVSSEPSHKDHHHIEQLDERQQRRQERIFNPHQGIKDNDPFVHEPIPTTLRDRLSLFMRKTSFVLLTSTQTLEDKAFEDGLEFFSIQQLTCLGIMKRVFFLFALFFFFTRNFINAYTNQKFISLDSNAGICKSVAKPWTMGSLKADYYGHWNGQLDYQPVYSCYTFQLFDFQNSIDGYKQWIQQVGEELVRLGEKAKSNDLATNLLYWSSWTYTLPTYNDKGEQVDQSIIMSGDPISIFSNLDVQGTISNVYKDCAFASSTEIYDPANGVLSMKFSYNTMNQDNTCTGIVNPSLLGWNRLVSGDNFVMNIDVRTLLACLSVSYFVNGDDTLSKFTTIRTVTEGTFRGVIYQALDKFDSNYPGMKPMTCIGPKFGSLSEWNCLIRIGNSYGVPFFNQVGSNSTFPTACDCSTSTGLSSACDVFDLFSGVIVYDITKNSTEANKYPSSFQAFLPFLEMFYVEPVVSALAANKYSFPAAFAAHLSQSGGSASLNSSTWRQNSYSFSYTISYGLGSLIVFRTSSQSLRSVTSEYFQLYDGACADSFSSPNFTNFYSNPWGTLEEDFYQCTLTAVDAAFSSLGVATGTATVLAPTLCVILIYSLMTCSTLLHPDGAKRHTPVATAEVELVPATSLSNDHNYNHNHDNANANANKMENGNGKGKGNNKNGVEKKSTNEDDDTNTNELESKRNAKSSKKKIGSKKGKKKTQSDKDEDGNGNGNNNDNSQPISPSAIANDNNNNATAGVFGLNTGFFL